MKTAGFHVVWVYQDVEKRQAGRRARLKFWAKTYLAQSSRDSGKRVKDLNYTTPR